MYVCRADLAPFTSVCATSASLNETHGTFIQYAEILNEIRPSSSVTLSLFCTL